MRISDWSSDVCSSDLLHLGSEKCANILIAGHIITAAPAIEFKIHKCAHLAIADSDGTSVAQPDDAKRKSLNGHAGVNRSKEHTYELQSLMRKSYAVLCYTTKRNDHKDTRHS